MLRGWRRACVPAVLLAGALAPAAAAQTAPGEGAADRAVPFTFRWGAQRPDLLRYNRVEGLSLGARAQLRPATPVGPLSLTGTVRLGLEDRVPAVSLDATHESLAHRWTVSAYHELAALEEDARHLGLGNSLTALLLGRDDGEYFRRAGASVTWTPQSALPRAYRVRAYAERHRSASGGDPFSLAYVGDDADGFRPNLLAEEGWDVGALAELSPWWGTDPRRPQGGASLGVRWGGGDWAYRVATARLTAIVPLFSHVRVGADVAGGTSWGAPPPQRRFVVGGPATLRGYEPRVAEGTSMGRVRGEVARAFSFGALTLFGDGAWAGDRRDFDPGEALWSAGVGWAAVDDLIRVDAAWGLSGPRGFRLELYLDGLL